MLVRERNQHGDTLTSAEYKGTSASHGDCKKDRASKEREHAKYVGQPRVLTSTALISPSPTSLVLMKIAVSAAAFATMTESVANPC